MSIAPLPLLRPNCLLNQLSSARRTLVQISQRLGFGTIIELKFSDGDPVFDPVPRIIRRKKNGTKSPQNVSAGDYALNDQWIDFFNDLAAVGDGAVLKIEISNGLPLFHEVEETLVLVI